MYINTKSISILVLSISIMTTLFFPGCRDEYESLDISMYQYRDTKQLVKFVYNAAKILENDGMSSIDYFKSNRDIYHTKDFYLYIYDINGNNIYNAGMKYLEGQDLSCITDHNGKKITQLVLNALEDKNNPHAWVHYSWWEPGNFYPIPKSSCHFKVTTPEGNELFVGGGIDYPHEEKEFIRIIVDNAVELIEREGRNAFTEISDQTSQYNYRDVRVFVFKTDGNTLISPVLNDNLLQIQLLNCTDEVGHKPFEKALQEIENKDIIWQIFMAKNRYQRELVKKCMYIRKSVIGDEEICVGAVTDLPQPPY